MKIIYEKTQYYRFAFVFDYSTPALNYCRFLKSSYGWKNFTFYQDRWRFNDPTIVFLLKMQFPSILVDPQVQEIVSLEDKKCKEEHAIATRAKEIKDKVDSDIVIPGIKGELYPYQKVGVEFFMNNKGRAILADTMGCLSGDTEIIINRGGNARKYKIKDAFLRFNGLDHRKNKNWKIPSFTRSLNDKKEFELNQIDKILYKGQKSVLEIVVKNIKTGLEKKIRLTPDHEIMSESSGWVESCKLKIGDRVLTNGTNKKFCSVCKKEIEHVSYRYSKFFGECKKCVYSFLRNNYSKKKKNSLGDGRHFDKNGYILVSGMKNHPSVLKSKRKTGTNYYVQEHVLAMEAKINKYSLPHWIKRIRFNKVEKTDRFIDIKKYSVHHKDGVKQNNSLGNLELLKKSEHARLEGKNRLYRNLGECFLPSVSEVVAVSSTGVEDVYDIVMKDPYRNFIANGIVVHNCGKTAQTLGYILKANHKRTLVVCPASVKYSWEAEIKKWTKLKSFVVTPDTDFYSIPSAIHIVIINYDVLKKFEDDISRLHWDCLVLDESQMIKSPSAIRTKIVRKISRGIKSVIMLSGTPLLSRPIELFTMLNIIDPATWNNYYEYAGRYCDGHKGKWGYEAKGATNLAELTDRISRYFLRRTKDQVLKDLPPKNRMTLPVDLPAQAKKDYTKASKEFIKFLKENKKKKDKEVARTLNAESLTKINYLREIAVMGRLDAAKELIDSIIDAGEKVLVFSSFNAPLEELADEYFDKAVMITGKVDPEERGEIVKRFQTDPKVQVFLGGYLSAGTGITLTAASNVIFLDYPWRPADALQAEDRLHRPGQTASSVNIYQLHSRGTIDDFMVKLLEKKQRIFDVVVESQTSGEKDEKMVDELIKILEEEN